MGIIDEPPYQVGRRKALIQTLQEKGITNRDILNAMGEVPRHIFVDPLLDEYAYEDTSLPIDCGQTISQPFTVAFQIQLLNVHKGDKILEIGTGSGYQTAVLSVMGATVFSY